jgi:hypothetical protein
MITILFSLGISLSQVSAMAIQGDPSLPCSDEAQSSQCCLVAQFWNRLSKKGDNVFVTSPKSCCNHPETTNLGIPGVSCTGDGRITEIDWKDQTLNQNFADVFGENLPQVLPLLGTL